MEKGGRGTLRYQIVRLRFGRLFGFPRLRFSPFGYKASFSRRTERLSSFLQVSHPVLCSGCCRSSGIRFFRFTAFFRHLLGRMAEQSQQLPSAFPLQPFVCPELFQKFRSTQLAGRFPYKCFVRFRKLLRLLGSRPESLKLFHRKAVCGDFDLPFQQQRKSFLFLSISSVSFSGREG